MIDVSKRRSAVRIVLWITLVTTAFFVGQASQVRRFSSTTAHRGQVQTVNSIHRTTMENYRRRIEQLDSEKQAVEALALKLRAKESVTLDDWLQRESASVPCVTAVTDRGETLVVAAGEKEHRIRLDGIDCPDSGQPLADRSLAFVTDLCFGREVQLIDKGDRDRRGGTRADVLVDGVNVGHELLRAGLARLSKTDNDDPELDRLASEARQDGRGLWADKTAAAGWRATDR